MSLMRSDAAPGWPLAERSDAGEGFTDTATLGRLSAMRELIGGEYGKRGLPEGQFSISYRRQSRRVRSNRIPSGFGGASLIPQATGTCVLCENPVPSPRKETIVVSLAAESRRRNAHRRYHRPELRTHHRPPGCRQLPTVQLDAEQIRRRRALGQPARCLHPEVSCAHLFWLRLALECNDGTAMQ